MKKNLVLASSSTVYGSTYLTYLIPTLKKLYNGVEEVLFVPFAQPSGISYDDYTSNVHLVFKKELNINVKSIHEFDNYKTAVKKAKAIYIGGGNTFLLVKKIYDFDLWDVLKESIINGTPYLGTSAGTNIIGKTMQTTNDMPIVLPKSLNTLGIVPFNFNAHYLEPESNDTHKGETRFTRIKELQSIENIAVLGLKEGSWLRVKGDNMFLRGAFDAYWFSKKQKQVIPRNTNFKNNFIP